MVHLDIARKDSARLSDSEKKNRTGASSRAKGKATKPHRCREDEEGNNSRETEMSENAKRDQWGTEGKIIGVRGGATRRNVNLAQEGGGAGAGCPNGIAPVTPPTVFSAETARRRNREMPSEEHTRYGASISYFQISLHPVIPSNPPCRTFR